MPKCQLPCSGPSVIEDPHRLLPIAYRAASRILRSRLLAEEASERALHQLTLAVLQGCPPAHPKAWLRRVARRSACALLRSDWARTRAVETSEIVSHQSPYREPRHGADFVREHLPDSLTPQLRNVLSAAVSCNGTRAAARSCGLQPRDFRRQLGTISRKARALLAHGGDHDEFADDAAVQFHLAT
jgi:hypothetical protein